MKVIFSGAFNYQGVEFGLSQLRCGVRYTRDIHGQDPHLGLQIMVI